jgi:hypothetical protein
MSAHVDYFKDDRVIELNVGALGSTGPSVGPLLSEREFYDSSAVVVHTRGIGTLILGLSRWARVIATVMLCFLATWAGRAAFTGIHLKENYYHEKRLLAGRLRHNGSFTVGFMRCGDGSSTSRSGTTGESGPTQSGDLIKCEVTFNIGALVGGIRKSLVGRPFRGLCGSPTARSMPFKRTLRCTTAKRGG